MTSLSQSPIMRQLIVRLARVLSSLHRRPVVLAAIALAVVATACGDRTVTGPRAVTQLVAPVSLDADINAIIDASFPNGLRTAAHSRWNDLKRQLVRTPKGPSQASKQQNLNLVAWIQQQQSKLTPPGGETPAHAAARLVLDISLYVFNGPDYQPPIVTPTSDVTLAVVSPTAPAAIVTPTEHAAVAFPAGAVSEQTVVVITQETQTYPENCTGPLDTRYCQYPQFYKFNVFPDVRLNQPARVMVCHINSGAARSPLPGSFHDNYRVAHDRPVDPADQMPGATEIDGVEVLPLVSTGDLGHCGTDNTYSALTESRDWGFGARTRYALARFGGFIGRALTPKSAYAIDQGGGGELVLFSNVAVIDTTSSPDFAPGGTFHLSPIQPAPGSSVIIQPWSVENSGTATSTYSTVAVLATDSLLTQNVQNLTQPLAGQDALAPQQSGAPIAAQTVTTPATLESGTYFIGVRIIPSGPLADRDPANNTVSVRVQVIAPVATVAVAPAAATIMPGNTVQLTPTLTDANGYTLTGRIVTWLSSSPSVAAVSADGLVTGVSAGVVTITAASEGKTGSAQVTVNPPPSGSITVTTAPSPSVRDRLVFPTQPTVLVMDPAGGVVPGAIVTVSLTGGGTLSGTTTAVTNAAGVATFTNLSIRGVVGARTLTFTTTSITATATTTLTAGLPTAIVASAGNHQSGGIGTTLPVAPAVTVSDADGNGVSGLTVIFTVTAAGGSVIGTPATTDAFGVAAATWTLGTQSGTNTLMATLYNPLGTTVGLTGSTSGSLTLSSVSGNPVSFTAIGAAGVPARLGILTGPINGQFFQAASSIPLRVVIEDAFGNPLSTASASITVAIGNNPGGGTLSGTTTVSTVNGVATFSNLSIDKVGNGYTLTVAASALASATSNPFTVVAGPAAVIAINAGNGQSATVGTTVAIPPSVKVTDAGGNPVSSVLVTFAVTGGGGLVNGAIGTTVTTNASGIATVSWRLGATAGPNTVTATRAGLTGSPLTFTATGTP